VVQWSSTEGLSPESWLDQPRPDQSARGLSPEDFHQKAALVSRARTNPRAGFLGFHRKTRPA